MTALAACVKLFPPPAGAQTPDPPAPAGLSLFSPPGGADLPNAQEAAPPLFRHANGAGSVSARSSSPSIAEGEVYQVTDLETLSDAQRAACLRRQQTVLTWQRWRDEQRRQGFGAATATASFLVSLGAAAPARGSLYRWAAALARDGVAGLIDGRGRPENSGTAVPGCDPSAWDYFKSLYLDPRPRSKRVCWEITAAVAAREGWAWPSYGTISARVRKELPAAISDYHRKGPERWDRLHCPRMQRDRSIWRPNEHWVGDHHVFDLLVLHQGKPIRPWLTAWLDRRSRMCVGWTLAPAPNSDTILSALRRGVKRYGAPLDITMDNGRDYRCKGLIGKPFHVEVDEQATAGMLGQLGIAAHFARKRQPESKGDIESWFKTVCEGFSKFAPTYCGNRPDKRPESLYADLRCERVEVPELSDLEALFEKWLEEVYHCRPHTAEDMHGMSPLEAFNSGDAIAKRTAPAELLDLLLMRLEPGKVTRHGVTYRGIRYGQANADLYLLRGRDVQLRIDPADASYVLVCDMAGEVLTRAYNQRLDGTQPGDVREGERRKNAARRLAKRALPAMAEARKTTMEQAICAMADRLAPRRAALAATGTDDARPVALIPSSQLSAFSYQHEVGAAHEAGAAHGAGMNGAGSVSARSSLFAAIGAPSPIGTATVSERSLCSESDDGEPLVLPMPPAAPDPDDDDPLILPLPAEEEDDDGYGDLVPISDVDGADDFAPIDLLCKDEP